MGPGTLVAATMADLSFKDLGQASAVVSVIPFVITGMAAAWLASEQGHRGRAMLQGLLSGLLLTAAVALMNAVAGTAPAGASGCTGGGGISLAAHARASAGSAGSAGSAPLQSLGRLAA